MTGRGAKWSDQTDLDIRLEKDAERAAHDPQEHEPDPSPPNAPSWPERIGGFAKRLPPPVWGLLALFIGILLGSLFPDQLFWIGDGVKKGFRGLASAAPYIIYLTLVPAIVDMMKTGSAAKFAAAVSLAFVVTTMLAGLWAVVVLVPVFQLSLIGGGAGSIADAVGAVGSNTLTLARSAPPFIAIWFGSLVALFLYYGGRTRTLGWFCNPVADVYRVIGVKGVEMVGLALKKAFPVLLFAIGVFIPTAVAQSIQESESTIAASGGLAGFVGTSPVTWYFICVGVIVFLLWTFLAAATLFVGWYTKFPARRIFKEYLLYVYPFAWATSSSAATIPVNLESTGKALGVRKEVREFIVPLGATVNLDGSMIAAFVLTVVAGTLVGYTPSVLDLAMLVIPLTVVTIGVPGIPGGMAAIAPPVITAFLPIPIESVPAFQAIWFGFSIGLSDQFRTGVNTCDNGLISRMFEYWYPKHFARPDGAAAAAEAATAAGGKP